MSRLIEWDGQPFAVLIEGEDGAYLVPPIVRDVDGNVVEGLELLAAIVESGVAVEHPVIEGADPGFLAEVDRRMAHLSAELGVPIGPPDGWSPFDGETQA